MHVSQIVSPNGGPGHYAMGVCNGLAKLGVDSQTLILADRPDESFTKLLHPSVEVRVLSQRQPPASRIESMLRLLSHSEADIFHAHYPSLTLPLWLKGFGPKLVCTLHGHPQVELEPKAWMKMGYLGELISLKLMAQNVPLVAVSKFTSREVSKIVGRLSPVVYAGIDTSLFTPSTNRLSAKQEAGFDDEFTILYVGRIHPYKDPMTLVRALALLPRDSVRLIVVGGGPILGQVLHGLGKFRINYDQVTHIDISELIRYYRAADVFVLPSRGEAAGIVLIEAMSCGLPVISTTGGGAPEIVGDAGLYFSPGNAPELAQKLSVMMEDKSLRRHMSETGRRRAEAKFSYLHMASRYLEIYQWLFDAHATKSN